MKKVLKISGILMMVLMIISMSTNVFAAGIIDTLENKVDQANVEVDNDLMVTIGKMIAMIRNFAVIACVIILIVLGIKYMMGSVEEKAGYQKSLVPLVVGIVVVMGATSIASFLFSF